MLDLKQIEQAINIISIEKNIPKEKLIEIIEAAIKTAYKKDYASRDEEINVKLDLENEVMEITQEKTVVKEVTNSSLEISFDELGDAASDYKEWDIIELDVTDEINGDDDGESFWRIASQAARQVIIQKIGDSEKEKIYELFEWKEGQVINMKIDIVEWGKVIFDYNGNQVVLPKSEQVSRDVYAAGSRFTLYIAEVSKNETGTPKVILSRKRPELVSAIFAEHVSEIWDDIISIDNIVRQPGIKTKLLVSTTYDEIDPVWTLIGQKGIEYREGKTTTDIGGHWVITSSKLLLNIMKISIISLNIHIDLGDVRKLQTHICPIRCGSIFFHIAQAQFIQPDLTTHFLIGKVL